MCSAIDLINEVWNKGKIIPGYDSDKFRQDPCGAWIAKSKYGDSSSNYGWVFDRTLPRSKANKNLEIIDMIDNLRPMHYANNVSKGDNFPKYIAVVKAKGKKNIKCHEMFIINNSLRERLENTYIDI